MAFSNSRPTYLRRTATWIPVLLLLAPSLGCAPRVRLDRTPPDATAVRSIGPGEGSAELFSVTTKLNGTEQTPNENFRKRVVDKIRESGVFRQVSDQPVAGGNAARLKLTADEHIDGHAGVAFWKGFLVGFSLFTLSPAIPFHVDYAIDLTLDVDLATGGSRRYTSGATGTVSQNYFQLIGGSGTAKLTGDVSTAALNGLVNSIGRDVAAYGRSAEPTAYEAPPAPQGERENADARSDGVEGRLQSLERLHRNGLISDKEYQQKRQSLLREL